MSETQAYLTLCCHEQWEQGKLWQTGCQGDSLVLLPGAFTGTVCLAPVDSGEPGFLWSRVRLVGELPREGGVRVYARASDRPDWPQWEALELNGGCPQAVRELFGPSAGADTDLWLTCSGRYLWLAVEFNASGAARPRLDSLSLRMSGDHMVDYLPAIYRGEDFTYRYLSIYNTMFQDMEAAIDDLPRLLDFNSAPPEMLAFLARWLCVDPEEGGDLRARLPHVLEEYESMYTPAGVARTTERLTGKRPWIIEHFAVDPNDPGCKNPALYRRLYGDDPYRFFLLLPNDTFSDQRELERFLDRMRELTPAGTTLELVLLKPCVQLDWHTYLGINSQISGYIPAAINEKVTIHYDTTIGGADHE